MDNYNKYQDREYMNLVSDILYHNKFEQIKDITHHGLNRYDHCVRVSYYSYKLAKLLRLDYEKVARAGLLHDFFLEGNDHVGIKNKISNWINHPKKAVENSKNYFDISDKEEDIIASHMFPVALRAPRYLESWFVVLIDDAVSIYEAVNIRSKQISYSLNFLFVILLNYLR